MSCEFQYSFVIGRAPSTLGGRDKLQSLFVLIHCTCFFFQYPYILVSSTLVLIARHSFLMQFHQVRERIVKLHKVAPDAAVLFTIMCLIHRIKCSTFCPICEVNVFSCRLPYSAHSIGNPPRGHKC